MSRTHRWALVLLAAAAALAFLLLPRPAAGEDFAFMPKGGRALLLELAPVPGGEAELRQILQSKRSETEWRAFVDARSKRLTERERATLAAYLAVSTPLAGDTKQASIAAALPPDGRELAWYECQSCHSLFSGYLTQARDAQAWRNIFLSPFHRQMKLSPREREEFARYSALNMPLKADDVPQELRY